METLAKSDVFFLITTIAVVLVTLVIVVAAVYIVKILNDIKYIAGRVKNESDNLSEDISDLRNHFKSKGLKLAGLAGIATGMIKRHLKKKRNK